MTIFKGTIALLGTPFDNNGKIDEESYRQEVDWCLENGVDGILTAPSVGEFTKLTREERLRLFQIGLDQARKFSPNILTMAMISAPTTKEAISYGLAAAEMGYASLIMVPPWYWHCTEEEVYDHYANVAREVNLPLCVYNNPPLTGFSMTPKFMHRLLRIPGIEALKETVTDLVHLHHLFALLGMDPPVLHIHRAYLYSLVFGCKGSFMAPFSIKASISCRLAFESGDWERASSIQTAMATLLPSMGEGGGGLLGMWKYASSAATGIDFGPPRAPGKCPDEKTQRLIIEKLENLQKLIDSER